MRVRVNRMANKDYYLEYDRRRAHAPDRIARRKAYQRTPDGRAAQRRASRRWEAVNRNKRASQALLAGAVKTGRIVKPDACVKCGAGGRIEGHHEDYCKPLDVLWLCVECHVALHVYKRGLTR